MRSILKLFAVVAALAFALACNGGSTKDSAFDTSVDTDTPYVDDDADQWSPDQGDCDDSNAAINPASDEVRGDGIDNDCDGADLRLSYSDPTTYGGYNGWLVESAAGTAFSCFANVTAGVGGVVRCLPLEDSANVLDPSDAAVTFTGDVDMTLGTGGSVFSDQYFCLGGSEFNAERGVMGCWGLGILDVPGDYTFDDAVFTISGVNPGDYVDRHWWADVTGDNRIDLVVSGGARYWVFADLMSLSGGLTLDDAVFSVDICPQGGCTIFVGEEAAFAFPANAPTMVFSDYQQETAPTGQGVLYAMDLPLTPASQPVEIDRARPGHVLGFRVATLEFGSVYYVTTGTGFREYLYDGASWTVEEHDLGFSTLIPYDVGMDWFRCESGMALAVTEVESGQGLIFQNGAVQATILLEVGCGTVVYGEENGSHILTMCQDLGDRNQGRAPSGDGGNVYQVETLHSPL